MQPIKQFIANLFKDKNGNLVFGQRPNLPILSWIFFTIATIILPDGKLQLAAELIAFGSIFTWAWLELLQGINTFRKILGAIVLIAIISSRVV